MARSGRVGVWQNNMEVVPMDCLNELLRTSYEVFQIFLDLLPDRDLIVASVAAFAGAWFATHFSNREKNRRINSIRSSIYSDVRRLCLKNEDVLEGLLEFIKDPVFRIGDTITICSIRLNDVSPMSHELIALGSPLSDDQRLFISALPIMVDNVENSYQVILNRISSEGNKGFVSISSKDIATLIYQVLYLIHHARLFCTDKENYIHSDVWDSVSDLEMMLNRLGLSDSDLVKRYSRALPSHLNS